jgi:Ca-activated chloride channel homolog
MVIDDQGKTMVRPVLSVVALLLLALTYSSGQTQKGTLPQTSSQAKSPASLSAFSSATVLLKHVSEVNLLLTVTKKRLFGHELTADDFAITDNGKAPREITNFQSQDDLPLRIALVIDSSDSVREKFQYERKACLTFLKRNLRAGDLAFVVVFNEALQVMGPATAQIQDLAHQIRKTSASGHTALYDAVALASQHLSRIHDSVPTRKIIVLLSDGEENNSKINLNDAINEALFSEAVIYSVSANSADDSTPERVRGDSVLQHLAESTGGDFMRAANSDQTDGALRKIEGQLRKQYMVSYKPADQDPDGLFHSVSVSSEKGFKIHHRRGYFAR